MFFPTHIFFLQLAEEAICGDKALKARAPSEGAPHGMAGFVQSLLAALGSGLLLAPLFRFLASFLTLFHRSHTKDTASSCTAVALSATLCIFAHAPLFPANFHICCPPAGLGVCLFRGTGAGLRRPLMCCLLLGECLYTPRGTRPRRIHASSGPGGNREAKSI